MTGSDAPKSGRLLIEGLVIVVSILLAFALDAGWDGYRDQQRLDDKIEQLRQQLAENRRDLSDAIERNWSAANRLAFFLESTPEQLAALPPDSASAIAFALISKNFYDQNGAAVESLVASADMELIGDASLRRFLALWSTIPDELEEDAAAATAPDDEVRAMMVTHGLTASSMSAAEVLSIPGAGDINQSLSALRNDYRGVDVVTMKYSGLASYARNLEAMQQVFDAVEPMLQEW